jgi:prepilin-type N-terminal cleavage/methylation domain-containing protein
MICRKEGFTLLELLIAIAIFGMVIGLAYSSYNATFHIIGGAEARTENYSRARVAMERIINDLEAFYPGDNLIFKGSSESPTGHRGDTLTFTSTASVRLHPDSFPVGHVIIRYHVQEDPDSDSLLLYRTERPALNGEEEDDDRPGLLLCDNLQEVAFDYHNKDGLDVESWGEDEEETDVSSLPTLISISLRFNDGQEDEPGTLFKTSLTLPTAKK